MQGVFNPNIPIYHLQNSAEGLYFSAFHCCVFYLLLQCLPPSPFSPVEGLLSMLALSLWSLLTSHSVVPVQSLCPLQWASHGVQWMVVYPTAVVLQCLLCLVMVAATQPPSPSSPSLPQTLASTLPLSPSAPQLTPCTLEEAQLLPHTLLQLMVCWE